MTKVRVYSVILLFTLVTSNPAIAQDLSNMFGTWTFVANYPFQDEECGAKTATGELRIFQRVMPTEGEVYSGRLATRETYSDCEIVEEKSVLAFVHVRGNGVLVSYIEPGWSPDFLVRQGDILEGKDDNGTTTKWTKIAGPSDADRAEEVTKRLAQQGYVESAEVVRNSMLSQGLTEAEAEALLWRFFDEHAACRVNALRETAAEQSVSFYEIVNLIDPDVGLTNQEIMNEFDNRPYEMRKKTCRDALQRELGMMGD